MSDFLGGVVFRGLERTVEDLLSGRRGSSPVRSEAWSPAVNVGETDDSFVVVIELAGIDPATVGVDVAGDEVTISGERRLAGDGSDRLRTEIAEGRFERTLGLPEAIDESSALASYRAGLLTVRLPKRRDKPVPVRVVVRDEDEPA